MSESTEQPDEGGSGPDQELVEQELLVEDISIDGMCGVY
ncbi:MAG TPA: mycofactocin precursor MftA [Solirubrobacterales bacterium]|nr:mycofactocin precursor MftA [Solirubrobacterales bacterium]